MKDAMLEKFDALYAEKQSSVAKDLKLNFRRLAGEGKLAEDEFFFTAIACAKASGATELLRILREQGLQGGLAADAVAEAEDSAAIMGMLNVYYRYRHFIEHNDPSAKEAYGNAGLRMMSLGRPVIGKEKFEICALAVSAINGCEMCVSSHEKALMQLGVERDKIHDVARLAAVIKGLSLV